ncbi:MAG: dihydrodipicolinate synthase family protein [Acidimicrobiales bacterium]
MGDWAGVLAFPVTTFDSTGDHLDLGLFRENVEYQLRAGVHHMVPLGSTGEFAYLTSRERHEVVAATVEQVGGRVPVIAGVSAISTAGAVEHAREAQELGADAALVIMQTYFSLSADEVMRHLDAIGRAVALPIFVYNNPGTSKVDFTPALAKRLTEVATIAGLKESSADINRVSLLHEALGDGPPRVLAGWDTIALPSFALGVEGWCSGLPNVAPHECVELYQAAVERRDFDAALSVHRRIFPLAEYLLTHSLPAAAKAGMEITGRKAGPPRAPLSAPRDEELSVLQHIIERAEIEALTSTA